MVRRQFPNHRSARSGCASIVPSITRRRRRWPRNSCSTPRGWPREPRRSSLARRRKLRWTTSSASCALCAPRRRRYRGVPPDLPSRAETVAAVEGLVAALYPRHFGPSGLARRDVDTFVAARLTESLGVCAAVELELRLAGEREGRDHAVSRRAAKIVAEFAQRLPQVRLLLDADIRAAFIGDPSAKSSMKSSSAFPAWRR